VQAFDALSKKFICFGSEKIRPNNSKEIYTTVNLLRLCRESVASEGKLPFQDISVFKA